MTRVKLVDYSESDGEGACEDDSGDADEPVVLRLRPPEPQSENELAQIVIELQHQYTKEVEEVQGRQGEYERHLRVWKTQVEDRLQMQVNVMAAIIKVSAGYRIEALLPVCDAACEQPVLTGSKKVFGVDAADPAIRDYARRSHDGAKPQVPPTSLPTVSANVEPHVPSSERRGITCRQSSPAHAIEASPKRISRDENGGHRLTTAWPIIPPSARRSTGEKVPRQLRGPHDHARNPRKRSGRTNHERRIESQQAMAMEVVEEPRKVDENPASAVGRDGGLQQPLDPQAVPVNPYDDPKYFSTLAVFGNNGTERPVFKFHKHPETVEEQWAEFKYGLHGQPPVERLEELYRAKWRNSTYGRSWFTRRKAFWDKVKEMLAEGRTEQEALGVMSRLAEEGGVPSLIARLCRERGQGSRKGRSRLPSKKRLRGDSCDEEGAIDSGSESDDEAVPVSSKDERSFHALELSYERVLYFDVLNGLASEYVLDATADDMLFQALPFEWSTELLATRRQQAGRRGLVKLNEWN
ncbi:hypothetical protein CTA2_9533 [Colletotrichum tanaceti]|uniref:Transcription activator GCR1-like domain-containing protein n=1 Tax=Colletotrichum tanaceti TaxID=1306861 RepID=A0A4U6XCK3_9PEZI|nr:hypothetical protein CTA2_9533 [Colletotrichum tanaceti]TKW51517.1 hypothetical protein CTA1_1306 [Colletotrichum tanaceti]